MEREKWFGHAACCSLPMGDKNPKQKNRQQAQKQTDKDTKAAKMKAALATSGAPVKAPKK